MTKTKSASKMMMTQEKQLSRLQSYLQKRLRVMILFYIPLSLLIKNNEDSPAIVKKQTPRRHHRRRHKIMMTITIALIWFWMNPLLKTRMKFFPTMRLTKQDTRQEIKESRQVIIRQPLLPQVILISMELILIPRKSQPGVVVNNSTSYLRQENESNLI